MKNPPTIKITTDYSMFKIIDENREIVRRHLLQLQQTIKSRNFLRLFPIIVNSKKQVIEGQHRLRAAEALGFPIYYIIDDEITVMDIAIVNNNRKSWSAKDYIHFYAKSGNIHYKRLKKLLSDYPYLTIGTAVKLCDDSKAYFVSGGGALRKMRSGQLTADYYSLGDKVAELCMKMSKQYKYFKHPAVILACKGAIMKSTKGATTCIEAILKNRHLFPNELEDQGTGMIYFSRILEVLEPKQDKRSAMAVEVK